MSSEMTGDNLGKLMVAEDTVAFITLMEAKEVPGVQSISSGVTGELYEMIKTKHIKGIKVEVGDKQTIITIPICVGYGYEIRQVAKNVQTKVARAVSESTELEVKEIHVVVDNIIEVEGELEPIEREEGWAGSITITEYVVAYIAKVETLKVNGVSDLSSSIAGEIAGLISKRNQSRGVKVEVGLKEAIIELFIIVEYGCRVPDVAWEIQERVKNKVEALTGYEVKGVNITVQGIDFERVYVSDKENH